MNIFSAFSFVFPTIALILGLVMLYRGVARFVVLKKIENGETIKTIDSGLVELSGTAKCSNPLKSQLTQKPCVYSRVVGLIYNPKTLHWKEIYRKEEAVAFNLKCPEGDLAIDPMAATVNIEPSYSGQIVRRKDKIDEDLSDKKLIKYIEGPDRDFLKKHNRLEIREYSLPAQKKIHAIGVARPFHDNKFVLERGPHEKLLLLADSAKNLLSEEVKFLSLKGIVLGTLLILLSSVLLLSIPL